MKIVQISPHFYPYIGGVEKVVYELSKQFISLGHNVTVLTTGKTNSEEYIDGIKVIRFEQLFEIFDIPINPHLFTKLNQIDCDIIHVHFPPALLDDLSALIASIKKIPCVLTIHSIREKDEYGCHEFLTKVYNNTFGKITSLSSKKMILLSEEHLRSTFFKKYENKIKIIPNGINLKNKKIKKRKKFIVLCVSLLKKTHRFKGIDYLIKALKHLDKIHLVIIGNGELNKTYQLLAERLDIADKITFTGYVNDEELYDWYAKAGCLCLPSTSKKEGFGLVALEAMSMGTPVIVTDVCGIASIVKKAKCGLVIKPKSVEQIVVAINKLFSDKKMMAEMGSKAYKVAKKYSWKKIANIYLKIYKEVSSQYERR